MPKKAPGKLNHAQGKVKWQILCVLSFKWFIFILFLPSSIGRNGAALDLINPIWKGINLERAGEKKPIPSPEMRVSALRTKTHPQGLQGADSCWEWPSDGTSEPSRHVTVIRMWLKLVQLHLSTYIPTSFPSCLSLLMAYSVLEGNGQWEKPTREQPKIDFGDGTQKQTSIWGVAAA